MPYLFCNIAWMERYQGQHDEDMPIGGGDNHEKHETCNFLNHNGYVYGYVQSGTIRLERIADGNADNNDEKIENVTIFWTARHPDPVIKTTFIVGWYRDATVFRKYQLFNGTESKLHKKNDINRYWIKADAKNVFLIEKNERICSVPRMEKGAMGQSNVWLANPEISTNPERTRNIVENAFEYINSLNINAVYENNDDIDKNVLEDKNSHLIEKHVDHEKKMLVENNAVQKCKEYYEKNGYIVESVEKFNMGWDLNAKKGKETLLIEVKGLSGDVILANLTANEYKIFKKKLRNYRLAVVTGTISKPVLHICKFCNENKQWIFDNDESLVVSVDVKIGAIISY